MSLAPCARVRAHQLIQENEMPASPVDSGRFAALKLGTCHLLDRYGDTCGKPAATWSQSGSCEDHALAIYREVQKVIADRAPRVVHSSNTRV